MLQTSRPIRPVLYLLLFLMTACAGGGGTSSDSATGKAVLLLTDRYEEKITDSRGNLIATAREIWVSFSEMALKPVEGEWIVVFSGAEKEVDLLTLKGKIDRIAEVELPVGAYDKAGMKIEKAWFIDSEGNRHDVTVPSGKITIKFKRRLVITEEGTTEILFDFIPGKSIHLIETGNGKFILRPVIRVKVLGEEVTEFVKVEGKIISVDCDEERLILDTRQGNPITVNLEDARIILKDGSFDHDRGDQEGKEEEDDDDGDDDEEDEKGSGRSASCERLQQGQTIEVVGTSGDEEGMIDAGFVRIETEEGASNHLEFTGTLLQVNCPEQRLRVTFSGGEIDLILNAGTAIFTADDRAVPSSEACDRLEATLEEQIDVEGAVHNNQVIAIEITLPGTETPAPI